MLTTLIETIISFFVANFEAKNHPYLVSFIKGFIAGIFAFLLTILKIYFVDGYIGFDKITFILIIGFLIGLILSLILMLLTFFEQMNKD